MLLAAAQKFLKGFAIKPYNFFSAAVQVGQKQKRFSIKLFIAGREFTCVNIVTSTSGFPTGSFGYSKWQNRYKWDLFVLAAGARGAQRAHRQIFLVFMPYKWLKSVQKLFIAGRELACVNIVTSTSGFPTGSFGYSIGRILA